MGVNKALKADFNLKKEQLKNEISILKRQIGGTYKPTQAHYKTGCGKGSLALGNDNVITPEFSSSVLRTKLNGQISSLQRMFDCLCSIESTHQNNAETGALEYSLSVA